MEVEKAVMNLSEKNKGQTVCATECPCIFLIQKRILELWH